MLNLVEQYLQRTAEQGGLFWESERGIPLGSSLSPILGAFFLAELDQRLERTGLFYVRSMDDILVLAPSRWKLRRAVRVLNQILSSLKLEKHPEKTFIGPIERGFDFLGWFALEESPLIWGDEIEHTVRWAPSHAKATSDKPLARIEGKPVRLRFVMKGADLYSLRFR